MKKIMVFIILVLTGAVLSFSDLNNSDIPARGELTLSLEHIWQIEDAEQKPFARIRDLLVGKDGTVYVYDIKNQRVYIVSEKGKFISAFGKKGEGPGEIREFNGSHLRFAGKKLVFIEYNMIHFFHTDGSFNRTQQTNALFKPLFFLNENEYITAPTHVLQLRNKEGIGEVRRFDLKSGKNFLIKKFNMFRGGAINNKNGGNASVTDVSLTPMMVISFYNNKLLYGMNDQYKINISDLKGNDKNSFSLKRKKRTISDKVKVDELVKSAKGKAPVDFLKRLAKTMPNDMTYFGNIEVHKDLIYVFTPYYIRTNIQQIDVFSSKGKYLYRAFIKVDSDKVMTLEPVIRNGFVYLCLEDEDGEISVNKYKISLPSFK